MENMVITYRRHSADCKFKNQRFHPSCGCRIWHEYRLNGKRVRQPAGTRAWGVATRTAERINADLLAGREPSIELAAPPKAAVTVGAACDQWLVFRHQTKPERDDQKSTLMARKLVAWCQGQGIEFLKDITTQRAMEFRTSLNFRSGDSSSLKIHWKVICGFFGWAAFTYKLDNPIPPTKGGLNPQFVISFRQRKVAPPTTQEVTKVLHMATGELRILATLMRQSGMALADATGFGVTNTLTDDTLIRGHRAKTEEAFRVRVTADLAAQLKALGTFSHKPMHYRSAFKKLFKEAKVKMTPHGFRHHRVSEWRAAGVSFEDISEFVGTSPTELRKTYAHLTTRGEERLDEVQRRADAILYAAQPD